MSGSDTSEVGATTTVWRTSDFGEGISVDGYAVTCAGAFGFDGMAPKAGAAASCGLVSEHIRFEDMHCMLRRGPRRHAAMHSALNNATLKRYGFLVPSDFAET